MDEVENILVEGLMVIIQQLHQDLETQSQKGNYDTIRSRYLEISLRSSRKDRDRYGARIVATESGSVPSEAFFPNLLLCLSARHKIPHSRAGLRSKCFQLFGTHPLPCLPTSLSQ